MSLVLDKVKVKTYSTVDFENKLYTRPSIFFLRLSHGHRQGQNEHSHSRTRSIICIFLHRKELQ